MPLQATVVSRRVAAPVSDGTTKKKLPVKDPQRIITGLIDGSVTPERVRARCTICDGDPSDESGIGSRPR